MTQLFSSLADPQVAALINSGAIGVIPTDTVYGLVAKASDPQAINKLYQTKQRELPPGTMIGAAVEDFVKLGFPDPQLRVAASYWPAPLSVVLSAQAVASYLKQGRTDLPLRIPNNPALLQLLSATGPLMTTSANAPKQPTSTSVSMAMDYFGNGIDFYVDGGDLSGRPSSTIIELGKNNEVTVCRHGAFKIK